MKWEYKILKDFALDTDYTKQPERDLNALGADGWELVTVRHAGFYDYFIFKRMVAVELSVGEPVIGVANATQVLQGRWEGGW